MASARTKLTAILSAVLAVSSWSCDEGGAWDEALDVETDGIVNGTTDLSAYPNEKARTVPVNGLLVCSGVILRPNVVLTARHCVTSDQTIGGPLLQPFQLSVNGTQAKTIMPAATNIDAAVLLMKANVVNQAIDFAAIDPFRAARYEEFGFFLPFMGYGKDNDGNLGVLRMGKGKVTAANQNYSVIGGMGFGSFVSDPVAGSATAGGDSGGPLWGVSQYPLSVAGVVSAGTGTPNARSIFAQAADFRHQVRTFLTEQINPSVSLTFDNAADINRFTPVQGTTGTAANWTISGSALVQNANAPQAMMILTGLFENVFLSTFVDATDDDPLGVIVRFVDKNNFMRCEANVQNHTLKLIRRWSGSDVELGSVAWTGTFNTVIQAIASENQFTCKAGSSTLGPIVSATLPIGKVGLWDHFNKGARFTHLGVAQQAPIAGTW